MKRAIVLGGGMVGSAIAMDLATDKSLRVTVADVRPEALARVSAAYGVETALADLANPEVVKRTVENHDVVIGALSSDMGLQTLRAVLEARRAYVDISFMADDPTQLSPLALENGVTAIVDCGVSPGVSNMIAGYATTQLSPFRKLDIFVGGLPIERRWPFEYKAGFAPHDVIEEYVRPARLVEEGKVVVREALTEPELIDFPGIGTLEAFNTDGLRSLATTLDVPFMREKTLRYPGHIELMRVLRATGFFSKHLIDVGGVKVRPLDVTAALMFPTWTFEPGERDLTVVRIVAEGDRAGVPTRLTWDMLDHHDPATDVRSMSRTTGYPAAIFARFLLEGRYRKPGVHCPEYPGKEPGLLDAMLTELEKRGVRYRAKVEALG